MEVSKVHIRHVLLWEFHQGNNATVAVNKLCKIYGAGIISVSQGQRWFQRFRSGNFSLEDDSRSGRIQVFDDELLRATVDRNPFVTVEELAKELNSTHSTIHRHLQKLGKVSKLGQWVSRELA